MRTYWKFLIPVLGIVSLALPSTGAFAQRFYGDTVQSLARELAIAHFAEPLVRSHPTTAAEDTALADALAAHRVRTNDEDYSALTGFLARYPHSGWAAALFTDLGVAYLHDGYFSRAEDAWQRAWSAGKDSADPRAKAIVDRAAGELAQLHASLGQGDRIASLLKQIGKRHITGSATEAIQNAAEELRYLTRTTLRPFNCGTVALKLLMETVAPREHHGVRLQFYQAGAKGTNLAELAGIAAQDKFPVRLISRKPGQDVPVPSVVHWKLGHFGAIVGEANGRYHVDDPNFPNGLWVTESALNAEASGYFLIPSRMPDHAGWRTVESKEAADIWGRGNTTSTQPGFNNDPCIGGNCGDNNPGASNPKSCGMCVYAIKQSSVAMTLSDSPVGYTPPLGPAVQIKVVYNQREDSQPAVFTYFNVSPKWTLNWLTYVIDDPTNIGATVSRYLPGGGAYYYTGYQSGPQRFAAQADDGSGLIITSASPITYKRLLADGGVEVYSQSDGSVAYPRKIFLTQVVDPQGNTVTLNYDGSLRLTSLVDATGRTTTFSYTQTGQPLLVTQVTDPFGRSASLTYDSLNRLNSITDTIGLTSSFSYDSNSLVNVLTTPYGTTNFSYTAPGTSAPPRYVDITDPMSYHERVEWLEPAPIPSSDPTSTVPTGMPLAPTNLYLEYRNSFYWDKYAYSVAGCTVSGGCDYTKANLTHFDHVPNVLVKSTSMESTKAALENRVWYQYPGQNGNPAFAGTFAQPSTTARVLDDGTTQLTSTTFDTAGFFKVLQTVDALGRTTTYTYANQIDLTAVAQTTANGVQTTIAQFVYNTQHRPTYFTNAAGQTSLYAYNAAGQITSITNPLGQTTSYAYNGTGDLTAITNANIASAMTYTYDSFDRILTATDSEGWVVTYAYDNADRITSITYPDGTSDINTYNRLDLASHTDRLGRISTYAYDANRRLTSITNPDGTQTVFAYNGAGMMTSRTDPGSKITNWTYDVEERVTSKTFPDSSAATYTYENTTSRLKSTTDALSQVKTYTYAEDDRVTGFTYTASVHTTPNVTFAYDPYFVRLTSMTDGTGTTTYAYGAVGANGALQLVTETTPLSSGTITYAYDVLGRLSSRTVQGSGAEIFTYDAIGRVTGDSNDLGSFTLGYLGQTTQITSRTLASSTLATSWSYLSNTGDRRLSQVSTTGLTSGQYSTFAYASNAVNETTGTTQTSDVTASYPASTLSQAVGYNALNQILLLGGDGYASNDAGTRSYTWDAENRLIGITYPDSPGKATAFTYDGLGRRVAISSTPTGGGTATVTSYIWCNDKPCQARDAANAVTRGYYGEGEYLPGSPAQTYYYAPDRLNSVRRVFGATGSPTYDYDPYGTSLQITATVADFNYAGTFYNADSGLDFTWYRAYDPVPGRWLSRDPIGESADAMGSLYGYVGGDPINGRDPSGKFGLVGGLIGGAIGAGGNLAYQLYNNGGNLGCVNWGGVAAWGAGGAAIGSGLGLLAELGSAAEVAGGIASAADISLTPAEIGFSPAETAGLRELFGQGPAGAQALLDRLAQGSVELPQSVSAQTLQDYAGVAQSAIDQGIDKIGTQALRLQAIQQLLK